MQINNTKRAAKAAAPAIIKINRTTGCRCLGVAVAVTEIFSKYESGFVVNNQGVVLLLK